MLLTVLEGRNFITFFLLEKWGRKVDKNDLNFNKQNANKKMHILRKIVKKCKKY